MTIQLKPGDYVATAGMTEEQYHAVAEAFMDAGALAGEYPQWNGYMKTISGVNAVGWGPGMGIHHQCEECFERQLTTDQILGTAEPVWAGEGLPPVGTVCEWRAGVNEWKTGHIIARYEDRVWLTTGDNLKEQVWNLSVVEFRPLRSEEDRAIDHMKSVAGTSYVKPEHMEMITRALYRAGYRKTGDTK